MNENSNQEGTLKGKYIKLVKHLKSPPLQPIDYERVIGLCTEETPFGELVLENVLKTVFFTRTVKQGNTGYYENYDVWYHASVDEDGNPISLILENRQRFHSIITFSEVPVNYGTAAESLEAAEKAAEALGHYKKRQI